MKLLSCIVFILSLTTLNIATAQLINLGSVGSNNQFFDTVKPFYVLNAQTTYIYGTQPNQHRLSSNGRYVVGYDGVINHYTGRYYDSELGSSGTIRIFENGIARSTKPLAVFNNGDILANVYLSSGAYHPAILRVGHGTVRLLPSSYSNNSGQSASCSSSMGVLASRGNHVVFTCGPVGSKLAISIKSSDNYSPIITPLPQQFSALDERAALDRHGRLFFLDNNKSLSYWDGQSQSLTQIGDLSQFLGSHEQVWELLGARDGEISIKIINTSSSSNYFYPAVYNFQNGIFESQEHLISDLDLSMMLNNPGAPRSLEARVGSDQGVTFGRVMVNSPYKYIKYFRFKNQIYAYHNSNHHLFPGPITHPEIDLEGCNAISAYKPRKREFKVFCTTQNPNDPTNTGKLYTIMLPR